MQFAKIESSLCGLKGISLLSFLLVSNVGAVNIVLAYEDEANFFAGNGSAKAAVDQAAADISNALTSTLSSLATDTYNGSSGSASATADWSFNYTEPSSGSSITLASPHITPGFGADEIIIYVGMRNLGGTTLGQGGPGGGGAGLSTIGGANFGQAVDNLEAASNAALLRGGGPVIATLSGDVGGEDIVLKYGVFLGNLWFDSDTNNDAATDTPMELGLSWHYDHTVAVGSGLSDLYTVALHEILHAVGFGGSETWNDTVSGTSWTGAE